MEAKRLNTRWIWISIALIGLSGFVTEVVIGRAGPILKGRVTETLSARFGSHVELGHLDVSILRGLEVTGDGLRIGPPENAAALGANQPLITVDHFSFHSGILGLFFQPMHVSTVRVSGLHINIPPREARQGRPGSSKGQSEKVEIVVDKIVCDRSRLMIGTAKPDKDPKDFELRHIDLENVGPNAPWRYRAVLTNAIPRGEIQAHGNFGPWQTESPGESTVTGDYQFEHADLNTIKGIGGILSSKGKFEGQLDRIVVDGKTSTPGFSLDTADHPVPLETQFHAVVDGITGDTYLDPVKARLGRSEFTTSGAVVNIKGRGHRIDLDVDVPSGKLQDFLELAVKTEPPVMTATLGTKTKLQIRPGKERVAERMSFQGKFALHGIHFTNPKVQDKVDMLSLRARGEPKQAKPGAADVSSRMEGDFAMSEGTIRFSNLTYGLPGAQANLHGVYTLDGQQFEFHGDVLTEASLSHMVDSPLASLALKAISPFFKNKSGGAKIPVEISGTKAEPKFGLDVLHK